MINPNYIKDIDNLPWEDFDLIKIEAKQIRRDLQTADELIKDAIARYKKKKLSARSKKQAEELATIFADLDDYRSIDEIQDAYGYDCITEQERNRLISLWEAREQVKKNNGIFTDRVTEMLEHARRVIIDKYLDTLTLADTMQELADKQQEQLKLQSWVGGSQL